MTKKQAVVIIHGIGEQRPMETLRGFVKTVWERDEDLREKFGYVDEDAHVSSTTEDAPKKKLGFAKDLIRFNEHAKKRAEKRDDEFNGNAWWIKPDDRAGLLELRRVTTRRLVEANDPNDEKTGRGEGKRTDFFEFYWADLVQGTTLSHLLGWVQSLLLRSPRQVPKDAFAIWITLWLLVIGGLAYIFSTTFYVFGLKITFMNAMPIRYLADPFGEWLTTIWSFLVSFFTEGVTGHMFWLATVFTAFGLALFEILKLYWKGFFSSVIVWLTLIIAIVLCFLFSPVILHFLSTISWLSLIVICGLLYLNSFLKRYFGDMARYVQSNSENVELRNNIRDRGLALLTELHESGDYDRIAIVAHSQGTIIAYDLISMLWSKLGPGTRNPPTYSARRLLNEVDRYLQERLENPNLAFSLDDYQELQTKVSAALSEVEFERDHETKKIKSSPWLISDFVTVGSPLSHAEFLLVRDEKGLKSLVRERLLPTCPPVLESNEMNHKNSDRSYSKPSFMFTAGENGKTFPHHAACFAAVRWTNIYDKPPYHSFLFGDPLSGSVLGNFGSSIRVVGGKNFERKLWNEDDDNADMPTNVGIRDIKIAIKDPDSLIKRWFTHNKYWKLPSDEAIKVPPNIVALRKAVNLVDYPNADWSDFED